MKRNVFLMCLLMAGCMMLHACCGPKVNHSMLSPEAKEIEVWLIDLGIDSLPADTSGAMAQLRKDFVSELAGEEYYRDYLKEVGRRLSGLGHNVARGPVGEGVIRIKPSARKRESIVLGSDYDQRLIEWNRLEQRNGSAEGTSDRRPHSPDERPTHYVKPVYHTSDAVRSVYIEIIGRDNRFLGAVDITGGKVKPEFVAKVLDRLIKEGEW